MPRLPHTVQQCRWSEPTLFQPAPQWLEAWDYPWICRSQSGSRVIEDTSECETCRRWVVRDEPPLTLKAAKR